MSTAFRLYWGYQYTTTKAESLLIHTTVISDQNRYLQASNLATYNAHLWTHIQQSKGLARLSKYFAHLVEPKI